MNPFFQFVSIKLIWEVDPSRPTQVVEKFSNVVDPFGNADKTQAHAEAHQASDGGHEVDIGDLVLLDDTRVVRLLEKDLQNDQIFFGVTKQNCLVVRINDDPSIEGEVWLDWLVADPHEVEVVVVRRADVTLGIEGRVAEEKSFSAKFFSANSIDFRNSQAENLIVALLFKTRLSQCTSPETFL